MKLHEDMAVERAIGQLFEEDFTTVEDGDIQLDLEKKLESLGLDSRLAQQGRNTPCSRYRADIKTGDVCYDVPQLRRPHSTTRCFCGRCYGGVLKQNRGDLEELEAL